jgi:tetratricopeptide (TPR) repeat protein
MTRLALACVVVIGSACAARGPSPQVLAELGKADALLRQGCYTCLTEAQAIYTRLSAMPRPVPAARQGAFDAAVLIAIRQRELGMFPRATLDRARELAAALPPALPKAPPVAVAPSVILDAAELVIGDTGGLDPEQRAQFTGRARAPIERTNPVRRALDAAVATNLVADYLALAIDCEHAALLESIDPAAILARRGGIPLMRFRLAICPKPGVPADASIREADSRFADTLLFEARVARAGSPTTGIDLPQVVALLTPAHEAFPASFAITMMWADNNQSLAEFETALSGFDAVLSKAPAHRDALIGRTKSLSYLMRYDEAIVTATSLIDLGTWHIGDAYYWRAWNYYSLKNYEPAWQDVEKALTLLSNSSVYMLAGLIEYARVNLPMALQRFDHSFALDRTNCDAMWMSALVNVDQQAWAPASPKFSAAMSCFVAAASRAKFELEQLDAAILRGKKEPTPRQLKQRDTFQKQIITAEERAAQAAFNAAQGYARAGQKTVALNHIDIAIAHPKLKEKAEALKAAIEKLP